MPLLPHLSVTLSGKQGQPFKASIASALQVGQLRLQHLEICMGRNRQWHALEGLGSLFDEDTG